MDILSDFVEFFIQSGTGFFTLNSDLYTPKELTKSIYLIIFETSL